MAKQQGIPNVGRPPINEMTDEQRGLETGELLEADLLALLDEMVTSLALEGRNV
jgi:hypothetical protein